VLSGGDEVAPEILVTLGCYGANGETDHLGGRFLFIVDIFHKKNMYVIWSLGPVSALGVTCPPEARGKR
jgi:hypothetical protein